MDSNQRNAGVMHHSNIRSGEIFGIHLQLLHTALQEVYHSAHNSAKYVVQPYKDSVVPMTSSTSTAYLFSRW